MKQARNQVMNGNVNKQTEPDPTGSVGLWVGAWILCFMVTLCAAIAIINEKDVGQVAMYWALLGGSFAPIGIVMNALRRNSALVRSVLGVPSSACTQSMSRIGKSLMVIVGISALVVGLGYVVTKLLRSDSGMAPLPAPMYPSSESGVRYEKPYVRPIRVR